MATVATRAPKRDLAPDWREALASAVRRFAIRTWGGLMLMLSVAAALALATHSPTDPSLSTAAGGPPTNWLGYPGAYFSDVVLLLFGIGAGLFVPVIAVAGLRRMRLEPPGHVGRHIPGYRQVDGVQRATSGVGCWWRPPERSFSEPRSA